jgi:hypothetical protein
MFLALNSLLNILLLAALEMTQGETPRWHDCSADRLECTKKRISLQNTRLLLHLRVIARNVHPHCAHDTKSHRVYKIHIKLAGYGQQKTTLPWPSEEWV